MLKARKNANIKSLQQVVDEKTAKDQPVDVEQIVSNDLNAYIMTCWEKAKEAKRDVETRLLRATKQRKGEYDDDKLAEIKKFGGSEVFFNQTNVVCRAAESMLNELIEGNNEKPWALAPSPVPEMPQSFLATVGDMVAMEAQSIPIQLTPKEITEAQSKIIDDANQIVEEDAHIKAEKMERKIDDYLLEGDWMKELKACVSDVVTMTGIFKAPTLTMTKVLAWENDPVTKKSKVVVKEKLKYKYNRVSPWNAYPSPNSSEINDGFFIEKHRLQRKQLSGMMKVPGYDKDAIKEILTKGGGKLWLASDTQNQTIAEGKETSTTFDSPEDLFDALEFWGSVSGKMLREWGFSEKNKELQNKPEIKDEETYEINAWLIDGKCIRAILNPDPLGEKPYYKCSFEDIPGEFWGRGIPDIARPAQEILCGVARALQNNVAIASAPMVGIDISRLAAGANIDLHPWKVFEMDGTGSGMPYEGGGDPLKFFMPEMKARELQGIIDGFRKYMEDHTGIPSYAYGMSNQGGAGRTATGLSMLMNQAGKGIKNVMGKFSDNVINGSVKRTFQYEMLFGADDSIKGDLEVQARGVAALLAKEQLLIRKAELLTLTNNPTDMGIIGIEGRAEMLRDVLKSGYMNVDRIIPPQKEIRRKVEEAQKQAQEQQLAQAQQMAMGQGQGQQPTSPRLLDATGRPVQGTDNELFQANKGAM